MAKYIKDRRSCVYQLRRPACIAALILSCSFLFTACGPSLQQAFNFQESLTRMQQGSSLGEKAKGFAAQLAVPGTTHFNDDHLNAPNCLLVSLDGENADALAYTKPYERTYQASITKVMTALVCLEQIKDLEQSFTVTESSVIRESGSSTAYLKPGDVLSVRQLLYALLLPSGNDAAMAIAEASAGSVDAFVGLMNEKAQALGATHTHFVNPSGLHDKEHYSTPYDIYLILRAALAYDDFREIAQTGRYTAKYKNKDGKTVSRTWSATDQYLTGEQTLPENLRVLGGKTGTTTPAGHCLAIAVENTKTGKQYISVVMKTETKRDLYENMTALISKIQ